jgi:hypothetical protein
MYSKGGRGGGTDVTILPISYHAALPCITPKLTQILFYKIDYNFRKTNIQSLPLTKRQYEGGKIKGKVFLIF